ncbi:acyl carrier protein [Saccharophagus sp. K07]|jgi:acyl carrier protein|uniref:acyl carrier protein n=1 Tax=Saccharophagus sp. K07 TaxID=2283636 RepID=UPI001652B2AD|nr:acyl carrier protein [Saccharophagus sp. K07]MBC6906695.1 acyl carrier protein [Saccharophagus sp. K07]
MQSEKPTREDVYQFVVRVLQEQFELDADSVNEDVDLREDLDIDSIDAVNILIELKALTNKKVAIENFHQIRTVRDLVDAVCKVINED